MKKPYRTGAIPTEEPNEPKQYPYQGQKVAPDGAGMDTFAENAKIAAPAQLQHISVPIDPVHVFGQQVKDGRPINTTPKMAGGVKQANFGNENQKGPMMGSNLKKPKI